MSDVVKLSNTGPVDASSPDLYFPRLQVNRRGEIVLATARRGQFTSGILVGLVPGATAPYPLGQKFDDWEVVGELVDYDGEVAVTLTNEYPAHAAAGGTS